MLPAVDPEVLRQLGEDLMPEDLATVVGHYAVDAEAMLAALRAAALAADEAGWKRAAHRLAGGAGSVGAMAVEAAARRMMDTPPPAMPSADLDALAADIALSIDGLRSLIGAGR